MLNRTASNDTIMARRIRLAVVRNVYDQGLLDKAQALELLSGPLSPEDPLTAWDDSDLLELDAEDALGKIQ